MATQESGVTRLGRAAQIQVQLQEVFEGPFGCWTKSPAGWQNLHIYSVAPEAPCLESCDATQCWFNEIGQVPDGIPRSFTTSTGQAIVAVSVREQDGQTVIVAGLVKLSIDVLACKTAQVAVKNAEALSETQLQQELIDQYAMRLTDSFEELTFLRRLSRHVDYCVANRSLAEAAEAILPQLRELASLEGLCILNANAHAGDAFVGRVGVVPDPACLRSYIDQSIDNQRKVIVRNFHGTIVNVPTEACSGVRSIVIVPIEKNGEHFGWLAGINKRQPLYTQSIDALGHDEIGSMEASLLEATALILGSHAANNRLFKEKEALVVDVIHTLVGVIEAKDHYTCGHSDRVALISRRIAMELGLTPDECQDVFLSGLLHDIGKIGVADDVLLKPGKLSDDEFAIIKMHPERGARLLSGLKPLQKLIPGVLYHHEAMDGSGYPNGLVGQQIPLIARILAVADTFDALTSDRPYRTGMSLAKAESILVDGSGSQWDPRVVNAFFLARQDILEIGSQWQDHLRQLLDRTQDHNRPAVHIATSNNASMVANVTTTPLVG